MRKDWDKIHDMYLFGFSLSEICKELGLSRKSRSGLLRGLKKRRYSKRLPNYKKHLYEMWNDLHQRHGAFLAGRRRVI